MINFHLVGPFGWGLGVTWLSPLVCRTKWVNGDRVRLKNVAEGERLNGLVKCATVFPPATTIKWLSPWMGQGFNFRQGHG
jgi:hypothetical protein